MATWTTPPATVPPKELSLGEVNFGVESRMFVFAYQSANTSGVVTDTSIPAYNKLVSFTADELKTYTKDYNILINPNETSIINTTDVIMKYTDKGVERDSGLRISSNGQIVGALQIPDQQKNIIFKVQYVDPPAYTSGTLYRAYSHVSNNGRIYRLRAGAPTPFTPDVDIPAAEHWEDIGKYTPQFSIRPEYKNGSIYMSGDYVVYSGGLYQLNSKNATSIRANTPDPDPDYWAFAENYKPYLHNPPAYSIKTYTTTDTNGPDGVYVQYAGFVYKLIKPLPYTPGATDYSPKQDDWDTVGLVISAKYNELETDSDKVDPTVDRNRIYQLGDKVIHNNKIYNLANTMPFKAGTVKPDSAFWESLGNYTNAAPPARIFRIIINAQKGSMIEFETGQNLHNLRVGERVGELFINDIVATSGSLTTYTIPSSMIPTRGKLMDKNGEYYPYLPKGLSLSLDGRLCGRPKGPIGKYYFDVQAQNSVGLTKHQRFYLEIVAGYTNATFSCIGRLSQVYEREWYKMISSGVLDNVEFYRQSDPNYGLRTKPEILFKDNILGEIDGVRVGFDTSVAYLKTKMYQEPILCRVGNLRYRTALDANGTPQYDYVYKELVPLSSYVTYDTRGYITPPRVPLLDSFKEFLVNNLASDDEQLTNELTRFEVNNGHKTYLDNCQLYQKNPSPYQGVKPSIFPTLPVAFLAPGEGQKLIDASTEDGLLKSMFYNKTIAVETMVFRHHTDEFDRELSVTLKSS